MAIITLATAVFAAWYFMNLGPGTPQGYLKSRRATASAIVETGLSKTVADAASDREDGAILPEEAVKTISHSCDTVMQQILKMPQDKLDESDADVEAVEKDYPLAELRQDADQYYQLCDYLVRNEQFWRDIEVVRAADIYKFNMKRDCAPGEACNTFVRQDELAAYINDHVMPVHDRIDAYHVAVECPFTISGGEQLCTGIHNDFLAERNYDGTLRRILEVPSAKRDDRMLELSEGMRQQSDERQRSFVRILGDYDDIYDLYIDEFRRLETKFAEASN